MIILSHFQTERLLAQRKLNAVSAEVSPDLGLSLVTVQLDSAGVIFADDLRLSWEQAEQIAHKENSCFELTMDGLDEIRIFSEDTNRYCSLYPTKSAPTIVIAGFPMHRIKESDPHRDTL